MGGFFKAVSDNFIRFSVPTMLFTDLLTESFCYYRPGILFYPELQLGVKQACYILIYYPTKLKTISIGDFLLRCAKLNPIGYKKHITNKAFLFLPT